jgi:hypothetical protein
MTTSGYIDIYIQLYIDIRSLCCYNQKRKILSQESNSFTQRARVGNDLKVKNKTISGT